MNTTIKAMYDALNGGRGMAMIGGRAVYDNEKNRLTVYFRGSRRTNICVLEYQTRLDLFVVTFWKSRNRHRVPVATFEGIYIDRVKEIFERETGMLLSL